MEWNDETIARLRALWAEGLSTGEIARRMQSTKNAVVGKAHRLDLPPRPSPIRRDDGAQPRKPPQPRRVKGATLPNLTSAGATEPASADVAVADAPCPDARPRSARIKRDQRPALPTSQCQWPTSNGRPWTFCCAETTAGRPYCADHATLAYVKFKAFLAIEPRDLRAIAADMQLDGAKTKTLTDLLAEVNSRRSARGQSEFFLPGMPERRAQFGAGASV